MSLALVGSSNSKMCGLFMLISQKTSRVLSPSLRHLMGDRWNSEGMPKLPTRDRLGKVEE